MRTLILTFIFLLTLTVEGQVHVKGYYRSNGTYVAPHTRSSPNSNPTDNYSYPGNTNPYTGKTATGNPDTYTKNLYENSGIHNSSDIWVDGYYRSDGTYVNGYWRSAPNDDPTDNFSYPGNVNPYTGETATGNPDTYLNNNSSESTYNYGITYYVSSNTLNLRSGPSTNHSILTSLSYGDEVQVLEVTNPHWYKVKVCSTIGYVYSSHLSYINPLYSTLSSTYTNNYNPSNSYHPYGYNKGEITVWTDCSDDGQISVYIDNVYKGSITSYFHSNSPPNCGDPGTLEIIMTAGTYEIKAVGNKKAWEGYVTVTSDGCSLQQFSK